MNIINNKNIFDYIKFDSNNEFSLLKGFDLEEMLHLINNYYLELRDNLGLSINDTFGIEIECEEADIGEIDVMIHKFGLNDWKMKEDVSLFKGIEVVSPILKDKKKFWEELTTICKIVGDNGVIGRNTGGHIHVGTQVLGDSNNAWLNFFKIWAVYEKVIFRFLYGEFLVARPSLKNSAIPCSKSFLTSYDYTKRQMFKKIDDILKNILNGKNNAINFFNVLGTSFLKNNTIEFRCPNGTFEPVIWQNNINLLVKLLNYCKSKKYNDNVIDRRRMLLESSNMRLETYHNIYLDEALELCDLVFDNNLDKIYFLRQYLKSFDVSDKGIGLDECKCFVKRIHD